MLKLIKKWIKKINKSNSFTIEAYSLLYIYIYELPEKYKKSLSAHSAGILCTTYKFQRAIKSKCSETSIWKVKLHEHASNC